MTRLRAGFVVLLCGCLLAPAVSAQHALPPHASSAVGKLLTLSEPFDGPAGAPVWLSASIEQDRVLVRAREKGGPVLMVVTVWHPDDAPAGARRIGAVALEIAPGPAPEALLAEVIARMTAHPVPLPWIAAEVKPASAPHSATARFDRAAIDAFLDSGDTERARQLLRSVATPDTLMDLAALALRWRLAGDPARAVALASGRDGEAMPHEVLALRVARGAPVAVKDALAATPVEAPCRAAGLARLLRTDRAFEAAASLADAIRAQEPACVEAYHEAVVSLELDGRRGASEVALREALERFPAGLEVAAADSFLRLRRGDLVGAWRIKVRLVTRTLMHAEAASVARQVLSWLRASVVRALGWVPRALVAAGARPDGVWCPALEGLRCLREVTSGTFRMGAQASEPSRPGHDPAASPDEAPVRLVTIPTFHAMQTEVDVRAYSLCVRAGGCTLEDVASTGGYFNYGQSQRQDHPMNGVSWFGAQRFCRWMGGRLPTEAEWEFLARGFDERRFPWGDSPPECDVTGSRRAAQGCPSDGTRPPGVYTMPSATGLSAMGGGVWEWVADWYGTYPSLPAYDPVGPDAGEARVQRGGGWATEDPLERRASFRASMAPETRLSDVGFRCVR